MKKKIVNKYQNGKNKCHTITKSKFNIINTRKSSKKNQQQLPELQDKVTFNLDIDLSILSKLKEGKNEIDGFEL